MQITTHKFLTKFTGIALVIATTCGIASAGSIFTNQGAFNTAVSGLTIAGSENFDALPAGPVSNPDLFMGGLIEIGDTNPSINIGAFLSAPHEWIGNISIAGNPVTITGPGGTSLGFGAFALPNRKQFNGTWTFTTSLGTDTLNQNFNVGYSFLGWVGTAGETLNSISYNEGGIALDNLVAYNAAPVPLPAAAWMAVPLLGGFGVTQLVRRRRLAA